MDTSLHDRFELFSPEYRAYLTSDALRALLVGYAINLELPELETDVFQNTIMLFLLGFLDRKELTLALQTECGLSPSESPVVAEAFLSTLPEQVIADLQLFNSEGNTPTLNNDITETETALQHVNTVRTMGRDMHDLENQAPHELNTHSSTQQNVLNRDTAPQPQWGSAV